MKNITIFSELIQMPTSVAAYMYFQVCMNAMYDYILLKHFAIFLFFLIKSANTTHTVIIIR